MQLMSHPWRRLKLAKVRRRAWDRLFPPEQPSALEDLTPEEQSEAQQLAQLVIKAHRRYIAAFDDCTKQAREVFETCDWDLGRVNAERRTTLYRSAIHDIFSQLRGNVPTHPSDTRFWMGARQLLLEQVFDDNDADLALTFFYSTMRICFGDSDIPVEYADAGLANRPHLWNLEAVCQTYRVLPGRLARLIEQLLQSCNFRSPFKELCSDAELAARKLISEWQREYVEPPRLLQMLKPIFFRDQEAYLVGKLCARERELPVVFALKHEAEGITIEALLAGKEDMRNILFVSTRSTFHVSTASYFELVHFLDTLAPGRGRPAMCAVVGFTHPARVALDTQLREHMAKTGEPFMRTPGRVGTAMIVFSPPSFPYVFKVVRDTSSKIGWTGKQKIVDLYRWVHETNRGRLMLDAWMYRNLHFPASAFAPEVLEELRRTAASSIRVLDGQIVLKDVYAQRRVQPLNTFFDKTAHYELRKKAVDALGNFIKDLARMGFFVGEHYGLTFNTGLTHALNVTLFDFDDLGPLLKFHFRETPEMDEKDELLWNGEIDGPWFRFGENDVLVDEWERYIGVPPDCRDFFRTVHGDLFTLDFWTKTQECVRSGQLHYVQPYPPERRLRRHSI